MTALVWAVLALMTLLGAVASVLLKQAAGEPAIPALVTDWHFWAGGARYGLAALLNIWVLRHLGLSVVLPATGLTYVWTLVIARLVLGEALTWRKLTGVGLICGGVLLIATS